MDDEVTAGDLPSQDDPSSNARRNRGAFLTAGLVCASACLVFSSAIGAQTLPTCATPGSEGTPAGISGTVNSYWTPASGTFGAATPSIGLSARRGAAVDLAPGDLALVIQMQCADINTSDSLAYGSGVAGEPAAGYTDPAGGCLAGRYQMVRAGPATTATSLDLSATPLSAAFSQLGATSTAGRRTFQVVRVPQFRNAALTGNLSTVNWDGFSGGVIAVDVVDQLDFSGFVVNADGSGFRGGGGLTASATDAVERFRWDDGSRHAVKGEGIAGTPRWVSLKRDPDSGAAAGITDQGAGWGGYPTGASSTGDLARGAPGNAGGGGQFWSGTSDNGGGGGGGNGGAGGQGGVGWRSAGYAGILADYSNVPERKWGFGGATVPASAGRLVMGGGGGAGDNNNNSPADQSSGAAGGGIVMLRAGRFAGTGSIRARGGRAADNPPNDGAGGGGAGGSVLLFADSSTASLSVDVRGGRGGDAHTIGSTPHGSGGGGGGGVLLRNAAVAVTALLAGGGPGVTTTSDCPTGSQCPPGGANHGAAAGVPGVESVLPPDGDAPASIAGYRCEANLSVNKDNAAATLVSGSTTVYTLLVSNAGLGVAHGALLTDTPSPGLVVTAVACVASGGGAVCPTPPELSVTNLLGAGVPIPMFPPGGTLSFEVTADVTASGSP